MTKKEWARIFLLIAIGGIVDRAFIEIDTGFMVILWLIVAAVSLLILIRNAKG